MKKTILVLTSSLFLALSQQSMAESIDKRQANQSARISEGVVSGELTAREAKKLAKQQAHIARTEALFKADGVYTVAERARLQQKQNKASARIFKEKHDAQDRN